MNEKVDLKLYKERNYAISYKHQSDLSYIRRGISFELGYVRQAPVQVTQYLADANLS